MYEYNDTRDTYSQVLTAFPRFVADTLHYYEEAASFRI